MDLDIKFLEKTLIGTTVPKPISGTLSGHAAGEPFDKHVQRLIKGKYNGKTFRQYEFLNELYLKNYNKVSEEKRQDIITAPALAFLLNRGRNATKAWNPENLFVEKQNDTADIIVVENGFLHLIDVKTHNYVLKGQPPNIISSYKLAQMAGLMLETKNFSSHNIIYIGVTWEVDGGNLKCVQASVKELFKTDPTTLYINWAAAMQIQFHVANLDQSYKGSLQQWCQDYLNEFTRQAEKRIDKMHIKFVKPFKKFLK